jgi:hypothetical protein
LLKVVIAKLKRLFSTLNFFELSKLTRTDIVLFCGDTDRGLSYSGKMYSQILDSLNQLFQHRGISTVTIAKPSSRIFGKGAFGNVISFNGMFLRAYHGNYLLNKLGSTAGLNGNLVVKAWINIIRKANPVIIIGIQPPPELCIAAKACNIQIFDLQHGVISGEGYYGDIYRDEFENEGWPDCILCWDKQSKDWIEKNICQRTVTRIVGNPWFLRFINPNSEDTLVSRFNNDVQILKDGKPVILVSLQWGLDENSGEYVLGMNNSLLNYIKEAGSDFTWWIRIHPVQLKDSANSNIAKNLKGEFRGCPNVSWEECTEMPLPLVLKNVDLHITSHSAVTIEACWFGVKTALLNPQKDLLYDYFDQQIMEGQADIVDSKINHINEWILLNINSKDKSEVKLKAEMLSLFVSEIQQQVINGIKE